MSSEAAIVGTKGECFFLDAVDGRGVGAIASGGETTERSVGDSLGEMEEERRSTRGREDRRSGSKGQGEGRDTGDPEDECRRGSRRRDVEDATRGPEDGCRRGSRRRDVEEATRGPEDGCRIV